MLLSFRIVSFVGLLASFTLATGCGNVTQFDFVRTAFFKFMQRLFTLIEDIGDRRRRHSGPGFGFSSQ